MKEFMRQTSPNAQELFVGLKKYRYNLMVGGFMPPGRYNQALKCLQNAYNDMLRNFRIF